MNMPLQPFRQITGPAAPLLMDDVDTDQIIPSAYLKDMNADMAQGLLAYMRRDPEGVVRQDFVLEKPQFRQAPILVVGKNFGCGSSREHAVWALKAFGIRCVIGYQLADFFRDNCLKNGLLPVSLDPQALGELAHWATQVDGKVPLSVDLERCELRAEGRETCRFELAAHERTALLEGLDDIGLTLKHLDLITAWEERMARDKPYLQVSPVTALR